MTAFAAAPNNATYHQSIPQDIRYALQRAGQPMSIYKLSLLTGRKPEQIKNALGQMLCHTGGVRSIRGPKCMLYALHDYKREQPKPASGQRAGVITIGRGSRWYSGLV